MLGPQPGWTSPACSMVSTSFTRIGGAGSGGENCSARSASAWPGRKGQGVNPHALHAGRTAQRPAWEPRAQGALGVISEVYHKESASPGTVECRGWEWTSSTPALWGYSRRMAGSRPPWVREPVSKSRRGSGGASLCTLLENTHEPLHRKCLASANTAAPTWARKEACSRQRSPCRLWLYCGRLCGPDLRGHHWALHFKENHQTVVSFLFQILRQGLSI